MLFVCYCSKSHQPIIMPCLCHLKRQRNSNTYLSLLCGVLVAFFYHATDVVCPIAPRVSTLLIPILPSIHQKMSGSVEIWIYRKKISLQEELCGAEDPINGR